jgi:hypothetical protein
VKRTFFEGWYFRVTLPEARDNLSLIYHVYDPDLRDSPRRAAGAQVCTPGGGYLFRESEDVDAFDAAPHELALRMRFGNSETTEFTADGAVPRAGIQRQEFYEITNDGTRHRGFLLVSRKNENPASIWPAKKRVQAVEWDFTVKTEIGYGSSSSSESKSTAGWLSALPVFEPHYQILMAHGLATGYVEVDGAVTNFKDAPAYGEKNWGGAGFPSKWFWIQCNSFDSSAAPETNVRGLTITATGANRGVVLFPGMREEVAGVLIHAPDGRFYPFLPVPNKSDEAAEVTWEIQPWGEWRVSAKTSKHECEILAYIDSRDIAPGNTTVLRAPVDDPKQGMKPSCRESFQGTLVVSLWERNGKGWGSGTRGRAILDGVTSNVCAVEVGGGPWDTPWKGAAEMREPLSSLAGAEVDVHAIAKFFSPFGDVVPGL